jgi:hypothetical protein
VHHHRRLALGQDLPLIEHDHPRGELVDHAQDVLDEDDGDARAVDAPDDLDGVVDLGRVEAGERLVEQQHAWPRGQRPGHLEQLALVEVDLGRPRGSQG